MLAFSTLNDQGTLVQQQMGECSCCHSSKMKVLFEATDYISQDVFKLIQCQQCKLVMTWPMPDKEAMSRYYPDSYFGVGGSRFVGFIELLIQLSRVWRARVIQSYCPQPGRILDIGCGRGVMLRELKRSGWECYGTELSEVLVHSLQGVGICGFRELDVRNCHFPESFFDVVSLWHSLEHLAEPCQTIEEVHRILKLHGVIVVATPNFGGWVSRWTRQSWFAVDVPRHLFHYDRHTLPALLESRRFRIERIHDLSLEQDIFGTAQSLLTSLGFKQNTFYDLIRNRAAQSAILAPPSLPAEKVPMAIVGMLLLALSFPLCLTASAARAGGTIEVWGRKCV